MSILSSKHTVLVWMSALLIALAGCAAPAPDGAAPGEPEALAIAAPAEADAPMEATPQVPRKAPPMSDPLPPQRVPQPATPPANPPASVPAGGTVVVDTSCRTSADCTVKNVGNCCGEYPACVNVNSPTDPAGVQAQCAAKGMASVCGFPSISGCQCVAGQCQSDNGAVAR